MDSAKLIVSFRFNGEEQCRTHPAARVAVDANGCLNLYDANQRVTASIALARLESFALQPVADHREMTTAAN